MSYLYSVIALFIVFSFIAESGYAQRTYRHSRVENGKVVTDYERENMPTKRPRGRAYREDGRIRYRDDDRDTGSRKGRAYRDESGKIRYQ